MYPAKHTLRNHRKKLKTHPTRMRPLLTLLHIHGLPRRSKRFRWERKLALR